MIKYTTTTAKNGRPMYFKNGTPVAKGNVPISVLASLKEGAEITLPSSENIGAVVQVPQNAGGSVGAQVPGGSLSSPNIEIETPSETREKVCIFCKEPATRQRYVNGTVVDLCDNDYDNHTTGEIVEQLRKVKENA